MNEYDPLAAFEDSPPWARICSLAVVIAYAVLAFCFLSVNQASRFVVYAVLAAAMVWYPSRLGGIPTFRGYGFRINEEAFTETVAIMGWVSLALVGVVLFLAAL